MRRISFLSLFAFLLSLGATDFCTAQQKPFGFRPEVKKWEIDVVSGQFWPVDRDGNFNHFRDSQIAISLPEGRVLKPDQAGIISGIIKNDFLVNDDATGGCEQKPPAMAMDPSGNFVICWCDNRNGDDGDIYAQRYNGSGDTLSSNFRVNDDVGTSWQWKPSVSMDTSGNYIICWKDIRRGSWSIYAQRYDSSNHSQGGNFKIKVDNDNIFRQQWNSSVSMDASGNFVISWEDNYCWDDSTGNDIYAQRYNRLGEPLGMNFRVDSDVIGAGQETPCVAKSRSGNFLVCFEDERNWWTNREDIYCQLYNSSGNPLGTNFRANDDSGSVEQVHPVIAIDSYGGFVICWQDYRNGDWDIYAQRFYSNGSRWGPNYLVNQRPDVPNPNQASPSVAVDNNRIVFA